MLCSLVGLFCHPKQNLTEFYLCTNLHNKAIISAVLTSSYKVKKYDNADMEWDTKIIALWLEWLHYLIALVHLANKMLKPKKPSFDPLAPQKEL